MLYDTKKCNIVLEQSIMPVVTKYRGQKKMSNRDGETDQWVQYLLEKYENLSLNP